MKVVPIPVICISGATASGKSSFALALAKELGGEIINADSVQVYRGFDIGSAKPVQSELLEVPHHLISHVNPLEHYSVGRFRKEAMQCIVDIFNRGKVPIVVGGTGLYIRGLFSSFLDSWGFSFGEEMLEKILSRVSTDQEGVFLHGLLQVLDHETASRFPLQDTRRVSRSLIQILSSGVPLTALKSVRNFPVKSYSEKNMDLPDYRLCPLVWILGQKREKLYGQINARVLKMIDEGLVKEVGELLLSVPKDAPPFLSIGYRHLSSLDYSKFPELPHVPDDLIEEIQRDTRRFAKRQLTWWRNQPNVLDWKSVFEVCSDDLEVSITPPPASPYNYKDNEISGTRELCELYLKKFSSRFVNMVQGGGAPFVVSDRGEPDVWYGSLSIEVDGK